MRQLLSAATLIALFLTTALAFAQDEGHPEMEMPEPPQDAYLDGLAGSWTGTGTMMGMAVTDTMEAGWQLGHFFFVSRSTTTMTMPDGSTFSMESVMMQQPNGDGTYTGYYFDSSGIAGTFTSTLAEGQMTTEWFDPHHNANGRAVAVTNEDGTMTSSMSMQQPDGTWADAGTMNHTRAAE